MTGTSSASLDPQHGTFISGEPSMARQKERRAAPRTTAPRNAANAASATPQRPTANPTAPSSAQTTLSNEEVYRLIAETAYFKAKARGFEPGGEVRDWIEAE